MVPQSRQRKHPGITPERYRNGMTGVPTLKVSGSPVRRDCHRLRTQQPHSDDQPAIRELNRSDRQLTLHLGRSKPPDPQLPHPGDEGRKLRPTRPQMMNDDANPEDLFAPLPSPQSPLLPHRSPRWEAVYKQARRWLQTGVFKIFSIYEQSTRTPLDRGPKR